MRHIYFYPHAAWRICRVAPEELHGDGIQLLLKGEEAIHGEPEEWFFEEWSVF